MNLIHRKMSQIYPENYKYPKNRSFCGFSYKLYATFESFHMLEGSKRSKIKAQAMQLHF